MIQHHPIQHAELPWDPVTMDVVCERIPVYVGAEWAPAPTRRRYNITQELFPGGHVGFSWGDSGPGSYAYALCILDRFLPASYGTTASWRGTRLPCAPLVVALVEAAHRDLVLPIPYWGATLYGLTIRSWIALHQRGLDDSGIDLMDPDILREIRARDQD